MSSRTLTFCSLALLLCPPAFAASHYKIVFIDQYDRDGDGRVSSVEFEQARRERFDVTDTDRSSTVDPEEYVFEYENRLDAQFAKDREEQMSQTASRFDALDRDGNEQISRAEYDASGTRSWERFDSNGDGVIDEEDIDPMADDIARGDAGRSREQILHDTRRVLSMPSTHSKAGTITQYDLDGDDRVTRAEFEQGRNENFSRSDSNGDGWISREEYLFEFEDRLDAAIARTRKRQVEQTYVRFGALDRDDDKVMTFKEYQYSGHRSFTRYDTDGDGYVTLEEADPVEPEFTREQVEAEARNT